MEYQITILTSLYKCEAYLEKYFDALDSIVGIEHYEVLLLHNEPKESEIEIIKKRSLSRPNIKHIIIPQLESLYATWNRGAKLAKSEVLTNWNVDDIRYPESYQHQYNTLKTKNADVVYGEVSIVSEFDHSVRNTNIPDVSKDPHCIYREFTFGCFPMWKKELHNRFGYFDEQFRICGDLEFQLRVAYGGAQFAKLEMFLGSFSWNGQNLSKGSRLMDDESAVIAYRYRLWHVLDIASLWLGKRFEKSSIINFGTAIALDKLITNKRLSYKELGINRWKWIYKSPYYFARFFKKKIFK